MHSTTAPLRFISRLTWPRAVGALFLLVASARAQTLAELSLAALSGKTLTCTIEGGAAPFETTGTFAVQIDVPSTGQYTIAAATGSTTAHTGSYQFLQGTEQAYFKLLNYFSDGSAAEIEFFRLGYLTAGKNYFEMFAGATNKNGTYVIGTGTSGGGGSGGGTSAPAITTAPVSKIALPGGTVTFSVVATGTGLSYQWYFNGVALSGEINANLILSAISALHVGNYTVKVTNSGGSVTSAAAALSLATAANSGRIVNMSVRASTGAGDQTLIIGYVIGGAGTSGAKPLLLRAVGPSLTGFGLTGAVADPLLTTFTGSVADGTNDNWAGDAAITATGSSLGAFALAGAQSKDAALLASPAIGAHTMHLGGGGGIALAEIYDASSGFTTTTPRLINVSARSQVGSGDNLLIAGFVIGGSTPRTVLLRAVGPTLADQNVGGLLADPKLSLFAQSTKIAENDNWGDATNATQIASTAVQVGAAALPVGSKDAALLVTLNPGIYTAQVSGAAATTGVALVEIFEAP